jgi:alkanesulfonate monooxygenase SsuD/methylene tetrahydromethanopterin reductase-like flavin-dependent oxidoreductase (luciferase family)
LTFRFAVVHSLPSAIRLEEEIVPDTFWSSAERCVEPAPPRDPNAILSAIATTRIRIGVMVASPAL